MIIEEEIKDNINDNSFKRLTKNFTDEKAINNIIKGQLPENIEIIKFIGKGGSSYVYDAKINKSSKHIILKLIKEENSKAANLKEIKILSKAKHKNIITMYGYHLGKEDEPTIIAMENGKADLKKFSNDFIKRKVLTETLLCYITSQILEGLNYLYKCNIVHRDIKPQNIIINENLEVKIIDFSIAKDISDIKEEEITLKCGGTQFFIAPEVIKQKTIKLKDFHKIDLFSLGVMLYRLAFGNFPFNLSPEDYDNDDVIYNKIMSDWKVEKLQNDFSYYFIDFLRRLLEKDVEKRININEAMNHHWIKGAEIILREKENTYNANIFLAHLITDFIPKYNEYNIL